MWMRKDRSVKYVKYCCPHIVVFLIVETKLYVFGYE